jgi:polyadenylate-binding protein 2
MHIQEIAAMKQRVREMEEEAAKLRELQEAAQAQSEAGGEGDTEEDRMAADGRSVYVGNVRIPHFGPGNRSVETDLIP